MQTLTFTLEVDRAFNAKRLAGFLKTLPHIKSVITEKTHGKLSDADWIKPGRPATDEELEQLAVEMDADKGEYTSEEVMESVKHRLHEWRKKNK